MIALFQFKRIRTKLIFWFLVLGLVPLSMGIAINYLQQLNTIKDAGYKRLMAVRDNKAEQIEYWLTNRSLEVKYVAIVPELIDVVMKLQDPSNPSMEQANLVELKELLHEYQLKFPEILLFQVVESTGKILEPEPFDVDLNEPLSVARALGLEEVLSYGVTHFSDVFNMPSYLALTISVPVFGAGSNNESEIIAVLQATFNVQSIFNSKLKEVPEMGETGEIFLVNQDGLVFTELLKKAIAPLRYEIITQPVVFALNGQEGVVQSRDYNGIPVLAAYTYIRITKWGLIVKQDLSEINKPVRALLIDFGGLLVFSIILLVAMASVVAESISRPIKSLAEHAKRIQQGDYTSNKIISKNEIGVLSDSFNEMATYIQRQLKMQLGMSSVSGSLVGSTSINMFFNSLINSLPKVSNASSMFIFSKPDDQSSEQYMLSEYWSGNKKHIGTKSIWHSDELQWMVSSKTNRIRLSNSRLTDFLGFKIGNIEEFDVITIPLLKNDDLLALVLLLSEDSFDDDIYDILEQTRSTINIGYSNAMATDQMSVMASNLFDINQELEKKTHELIQQSEQLKKSASELQKRNIELEIQRKEVESISKLKSEFLSNMSHELRTPLHVILTLSGVIKKQLLDQFTNPDELEYLEVIHRNGQILLKLVTDILDLSRIEAGKASPVIRPFSLIGLLQSIMSNIQALADEKGLDFSLDVKGNVAIINSDEEKLYQVFQNIIGNAIKFTQSGSVKIEVVNDNQEIIVNIIDTGIGIHEDQLHIIFDEFVQADGSTTRNYQGTGLGLAIANKIIQLLHGSISVESKVGHGSTFSVRIPIAIPDDDSNISNLNGEGV